MAAARPANFGTWVFVFRGGRFVITQENALACTWAYGTYIVQGERIGMIVTDGGGEAPTGATAKPGDNYTYRWSRYRDTLTLNAAPGGDSPNVLFLRPWHRLSAAAAPKYLSSRCPPPAATVPH